MSEQTDFKLAAVILAAGSSTRMGRPKMLLPWGETSVVGHLIGVWSLLPVAQVAVVCAATDAAIAAEFDRLRFPVTDRILNLDPSRGMFSSVQCAARWRGWRSSPTHYAIVLGDQPHLTPATLAEMIARAKQNPGKISQPSRGGHGRHPVFLPASALRKLAESRAISLKQFLESMAGEVRQFELDDPGLDLDIDHPEDYQKLLRMVFER
jgi:molybdenum cofactor cytidylyltransferase